jgi:hypothetical protein
MGGETPFFLVRDLGQDVPHKMHLATLPGSSQELLFHRGLDAGNGKLNSQGHGKQFSHGLGKWNSHRPGTPVRLGKTLQERE